MRLPLLKKNPAWILFCLMLILMGSASCKKSSNSTPELSASQQAISFDPAGGSVSITVNSNLSYNINNPGYNWVRADKSMGNSGTTTITFSALSNTGPGSQSRSTTITLSSVNNDKSLTIPVSQANQMYQSYNTSPIPADMTGMPSTAIQLASKMRLGLNIGNTMEAPNVTGWGNPIISADYIRFIKSLGFTAVRIPCSWDAYADPTTKKISDTWLASVKQVVQYCVDNGLYVMVNIHWDGGWLENNCTPAKKDAVNAQQKAFWEQIATALRGFDEHLLFASANEPATADTTQMKVLLSYHQTFVNAVRSTGGHNKYRILVVQGNNALMNAFPTDQVAGRIMYEDHNYTPFQFAALDSDASWGKMFYYWGAGNHSTIEPDRNATWGEEADQAQYYAMIKSKFIDKGIPVLMGEYGAYRRTTPLDMVKHQASVDAWITYNTRQALQIGMIPFFWETGGILDRVNNKVLDQRTINAIKAGAQ